MNLLKKILFCFPIGVDSEEGGVKNEEESKALIKYSRVSSEMSDITTDITTGEAEN